MADTNLVSGSEVTQAVRHEPNSDGTPQASDGRAVTSAANGRHGGAPRGSGFKVIDRERWRRLGGRADRATAQALGVSVRTLRRRLDW